MACQSILRSQTLTGCHEILVKRFVHASYFFPGLFNPPQTLPHMLKIYTFLFPAVLTSDRIQMDRLDGISLAKTCS
jgi:hypothetical protein